MTLQEFFEALTNTNMVVTVNEGFVELTKIYASGYEQLQSSLLAKEISKITIQNVNSAVVDLVYESN